MRARESGWQDVQWTSLVKMTNGYDRSPSVCIYIYIYRERKYNVKKVSEIEINEEAATLLQVKKSHCLFFFFYSV